MTKRNNKEISKNNDIDTDDDLDIPKKIPKISNDAEAKKSTIKLKVPIPKIILDQKVETLDDLIALGKLYDPSKEYNINLKKVHKILPSLEKLKNVIGMKTVKDSLVGRIIFFLNEFDPENKDMLHTVIQGPPGVGKTTLGKIIGELYYYLDIIKPEQKPKPEVQNIKMNVRNLKALDKLLNIELDKYMNRKVIDLDDDDDCDECDDKECECPDCTKAREKSNISNEPFKFKIVKRSDLIAGYLGQSAIKCQKVIDSCQGGVLFIDEAYSLGNPEGRDSFSKEVIDTLNQNLSEQKCNFLCIIAGYKESLDTCFFAYNDGLRRRFPFVYTIEKYTGEELCEIFKKLIDTLGWTSTDINEKFFVDNYDYFNNMGGDMETLLFMTKIEHGKRVIFKPLDKKKISMEDITNAFKQFKVNKQLKKSKEEINEEEGTWKTLYT